MQTEKPRVRATAELNLADQSQPKKAMAFKFGDPESVLNSSISDYLGVFATGDYYEPPVSLPGLGKILRANGYHCTIPPFRRNRLLQYYISNETLPDDQLGAASIDFDVFGNCYFQMLENAFGEVIGFRHLAAMNMRKAVKDGVYVQLQKNGKTPIKFKPGEVIHLKEYDVNQGIYGIPQYFGGINAVLLGEEATLFRRKYYVNGAHMGYILYTADPSLDEKDEAAIKKAVTESKGVGNFRSLYLNIPNGKEKSVQLIPVGDIATKDEFERIKNITRDEILAMWRIQAALAGVRPDNTGGYGDIEKIAKVYFQYETVPMQDNFLQLNQYLKGSRKLQFTKPAEGEF
jgi:PBSX family phage portal protein